MTSHWYYNNEKFDPTYETILMNHTWGFTYLISHIATGKMYIGKKSMHTMRNKQKRESLWRTYIGSCEKLTHEIIQNGSGEYHFEILTLTKNAVELSYCEIKELYARDVLRTTLETGDPAYYNDSIPGQFFRRNNEVGMYSIRTGHYNHGRKKGLHKGVFGSEWSRRQSEAHKGQHSSPATEFKPGQIVPGTWALPGKFTDEQKAILNKHHKAIVTCPKCGKRGAQAGMKRWHFDNCQEGLV